MASPTVTNTNGGATGTSGATTLACTVNSTSTPVGSLVQMLVYSDGNPTLSTSSAGWSKVGQWSNGTSVTLALFEFTVTVANTVGALTVNSTATEIYAAQQVTIKAGTAGENVVRLTPPSASTGTGGRPDSPVATQNTGQTYDVLWLSAAAQDQNTGPGAAPTNYTNFASQSPAGTAGNTVRGACASRQMSAVVDGTTEDPGIYGGTSTTDWVAQTFCYYSYDPNPKPNAAVSASQLSSPTITAHAILTPDSAVSASLTDGPSVAHSYVALQPDNLLSHSFLGGKVVNQNVHFDSNVNNWTIWSANVALSWQSGGAARITNSVSVYGSIYQDFNVTVNARHRITAKNISGTPSLLYNAYSPAGGANMGTTGDSYSGGILTANFVPTSATARLQIGHNNNSVGFSSDWDYVQVEELAPVVQARSIVNPDALASATLTDQPAITAHAVLTPNAAVSASLTTSPSVAWKTSVSPAALIAASLTSQPNVFAYTSTPVVPNDLTSASQTTLPVITAHAVVVPASLLSASLLGQPTITAHAFLTPAGLNSASQLSVPTVAWKTSITPAALNSTSLLDIPVTTAHAFLTPAALNSAAQLASPNVTWKTSVAPAGLTSSSQLGIPSVSWKTSISPAQLTSLSQLTVPTVQAFSFVYPNNLTSASQFSSVTLTIHYSFDDRYIKPIAQKWPAEAYPEVYHGVPF